jgi:hypothetical protein
MMNNQYKKLKAGNRGDSGYFLKPLAKSFYENGVFSTSFNEYQKINLSPVLRRLNGELFTSISLHPKSLYDSGDTIKDENVSKIAMLFIDLDFIDDEKKIQFKRLLKEKKYDDLKEIYTPILKNLTSAYMQVMGKKPSYINISGGGFHLIDLLPSSHCWTKEGIDYLKMNQSSLDISGLKIIDKNQWKSIYNEIISQIKKTFTDNTLYLDEKCSNLSRLLRDIGFYHEKDKANPHEIETIKDDDFIEHGEIKSQIIDGLLSEALKKEALNTQEKDHRGDKDHGGEEGYHFKMNQRVKIYKKNDNKGMLYKIDDLYQALKYDELESFIEKNGDYYNIQASLYEEDFPPNAEKDRPADKGSLLISIENMGRGVNRYTKATLKLQLRNKEGRFKEALDGASFGVYPSIYTYTKTDPRSFGMIATNVIINKNEKEIYLYNENAYHIDSSGERKDYEKSSLYDDLTKVLWSDEKGKPIDISTISQATAQIVYNQLKAKAKKIDRFSLLPVLNDDFQIEHCAGYHANTKSYILPPKAHDFKDFKIDESLFNDPKKMGDIIKEEADYIDSLFSFPLKKKEYSLQIIGALLEIFIQDRLANKPFLVIQANEQGRGKTLLAKALSAAIGSIDPTLTPFEQNKATLKDEITSQVNSILEALSSIQLLHLTL